MLNQQQIITLYKLIIFISMSLFLSFFSAAYTFDIKQEKTSLSPYLHAMYDHQQLYTPEEILADIPFQKTMQQNHIKLNFSTGTVWLATTLSHNSTTIETFVFELQNNKSMKVDYYLYDEQQKLIDKKLFSKDSYQLNKPILGTFFNFSLAPNTQYQMLVKLQHVNSATLPVMWRKDAFDKKQSWLLPLIGAYIGILLVLCIFNLITYSGSRDIAYIWFALYTLTSLFWSNLFTGYAPLFLSASLYQALEPITIPLVLLGFTLSGIFCYHFTEISEYSNKTARWLRSTIAISATATFISIFLSPAVSLFVVGLITLLAAPCFIFSTFRSWTKQRQGARYYLMSWLPILIAAIYTQLSVWHVVPASEYRGLYLDLAILAQVLLMSLAITDKLRRSEEEKNFLANHDSLTKLPNHHLLLQRITEKKRYRELTIVQIEIQRISDIQNTLGIKTANETLRIISKRLVNWAIEQRLIIALEKRNKKLIKIASLQRGCFTFIMRGTFQTELSYFIEELREVVHKPIEYNDITLECICYAGVAHSKYHGNNANTLVQNTNIAANLAVKGKQDFVIYSDEKNLFTERRLAMISDLKHALSSDSELSLYLQPQVELATGRVKGAEALIRWQHREHGLISPMEMIPMAEESGIVTDISIWAIKEALELNRIVCHSQPNHVISVNISAHDLENNKFVGKLKHLLDNSSLPNHLLLLEVTESAMMKDPSVAHLTLAQIHALGVQTSIDDFGTGYSSLSYLSLLPVNELKVDRSFIVNIDDFQQNHLIAENILGLSKKLNLKTVAEGIEDKATFETLKKMGYDIGQGFYISKPLKQSEYSSWLIQYDAQVIDINKYIG